MRGDGKKRGQKNKIKFSKQKCPSNLTYDRSAFINQSTLYNIVIVTQTFVQKDYKNNNFVT